MKIHILGIGGTFMAGIAIIAKQLGHQVTGSDKNLYDPMKSVLEKENIILYNKFNVSHCRHDLFFHVSIIISQQS